MDPQRRPGEGRYARVEREQRWALHRRPDGLDRPAQIDDLYLGTDTSLRLRRVVVGTDVVYKLGQKVRPDPARAAVAMMTNMYLSRSEYEFVARLPGRVLSKTRWRLAGAPRHVVVDEFHGPLAGLVLAETELGPDDAWMSDLAGVEAVDVTDDDRYSGGRLAGLTPDDAADLVRATRSRFDPTR